MIERTVSSLPTAIALATILLASSLPSACRTAFAPIDGTRTELPHARSPTKAVRLARDLSDAAHAAEVAWLEGNDRILARHRLDEGLAVDPHNAGLLLRRGMLSLAELDDDPALDDLLSILEHDPRSPEVEAALLLIHASLLDLHHRHQDIRRVLKGANLSATIGRALPSAIAVASVIGWRIENAAGDLEAALVNMQRGGWLNRFRGIGPLGPRVSASLDVPTTHELRGMEPTTTPDAKPRALPDTRPDVRPATGDQSGLFVLETYFEIGHASVDVEIREGLPVILEVHLDSPGRVRIDGVVVEERRMSTVREAGSSRITLRLLPGWHRLTIAMLAGGTIQTGVSLLTESGLPAAIRHQAEPPHFSLSAGALSARALSAGAADKARPSTMSDLVLSLVTDPKRTLFGRVLGAQLARTAWTDDIETARRLTRTARIIAPRSAAILATEAKLMRQESVPRSLSSSKLEDALKLDPSCPSILTELASGIREDAPDRAMALLTRARIEAPRSPDPIDVSFLIARDRGWNAEASRSLMDALERRESERLLDSGARFYRSLLRVSDAEKLERRAIDLYDPFHGIRTANAALLRGETDAAITALERAAERSQDPAAFLARIASLEVGRGRVESAIAAATKALVFDPLSQEALRQLAAANAVQGNREATLRVIEALRRLGGTDTRLEAFAAEVDGTTPGQPRKGSWLEGALRIDAPFTPTEEEIARWGRTKSVRVLDRVVDWVRPTGHSLSMRHAVTRLQTKDATARSGELNLPAGALALALRTIKADGRTIEVDRHEGKEDLSFSALAPGDAIEKQWVTLDEPATPWGGYIRKFFFRGPSPVLRAEFVVVAPLGARVWWRAYNGAPNPIVESDGEGTVYLFRAMAVPALDPEPSSVAHEEYLPFVVMAIDVDQALARRSNTVGLDQRARTSWDIQQLARSLTQKLGVDTTAEDRVRAIYGWVEREIGHGSVSEPSLVLATKRGDRTGLLTALLRAADIDATIVLARPGAAPSVEPSYPNPGEFALPLVRIRPSVEHTMWARMDQPSPWIGRATPDLEHGMYIALSERPGAPPISVPFRDQEIEHWTLSSSIALTIDTQGVARGTLSLTLPGRYGSDLRDFFQQARKEQTDQAVQSWIATLVPGAHLLSVESDAGASELDAMKLTASIEVADFMVRDGSHLVAEQLFNEPIAIRALGLPDLSSYLRVPNRKIPLFLGECEEEMRVILTLPKGAKNPIEAPRTFDRKSAFGHFSQAFRWDPRAHTALLIRKHEVPTRRVAPSAFPKFSDIAQEVLQATRNRFILSVDEGAR